MALEETGASLPEFEVPYGFTSLYCEFMLSSLSFLFWFSLICPYKVIFRHIREVIRRKTLKKSSAHHLLSNTQQTDTRQEVYEVVFA